jgi:hypothetical protein
MTIDRGLTPWFDGKVKPVRAGVYQRKFNKSVVYSYFDCEKWFSSSRTIAMAEDIGTIHDIESVCGPKQWRGLSTDPTKGGGK